MTVKNIWCRIWVFHIPMFGCGMRNQPSAGQAKYLTSTSVLRGCKLCIFETTFACKSELDVFGRLKYITMFQSFVLGLDKTLVFIA